MDIQGRRGELVERLIALIDDDPEFDPDWWVNAGMIVAEVIGGISVLPSTDRPPPSGSAGAHLIDLYGTAPRDDYIALIRSRLMDLVSLYISEAFLVRAVRDELARWMESMADTGAADERRMSMRENMREMSEDPNLLGTWRARLTTRIPAVAEWSDEQLTERLQEMANSSLLDPTDADAAADRWAAKLHFDHSVESHLSDAHIERWSSMNAAVD